MSMVDPSSSSAAALGELPLPLARQGVDVTGMDASHSMLEVLRAKLTKESECVRRRTRVIEGDFRTHYLDDQFSLVVIPFRPMQHMYTTGRSTGGSAKR